uniref:Uncharacterized protein n=1 Tax=Acrobeloides nanus TaxID=290746 RepID=A0A914E923_9BILA
MVWRKTSCEVLRNHSTNGDSSIKFPHNSRVLGHPRVHVLNANPSTNGASNGNCGNSSSMSSSTDTRDSNSSSNASPSDHHPPVVANKTDNCQQLLEIESAAGGNKSLENHGSAAINSHERGKMFDGTHEDKSKTKTSLSIPTGITSSAATSEQQAMINGSASGSSLYVSAQTIEEQIRQVDKIVKDCDNSRKSLELISRRLDDLHDEVRRYREFLGHEKSRRDPALYKTSNVDRPSAYNDSICGTMSTLTAQLTQEWTDKLRSIQGALCIPQTPSTPVGSAKALDGR